MNATLRSEAQLLHEIADQMRTGRHGHRLLDAILATMHGERHERYVNLVAAIATGLCLAKPHNGYDEDNLPYWARQSEQPGGFQMRLEVWAAQIHDPTLIAATLDAIAAPRSGS